MANIKEDLNYPPSQCKGLCLRPLGLLRPRDTVARFVFSFLLLGESLLQMDGALVLIHTKRHFSTPIYLVRVELL